MNNFHCLIYNNIEECYIVHNWPWFVRNDHPCDKCKNLIN